MLEKKSFIVREKDQGTRLDKFLFKSMVYSSRSQIKKLIESGLVTVDGKPAKASQSIRKGQIIEAGHFEKIVQTLASEEIPLDIIYEDSEIVVVNKSAGMVVHPAPGHDRGTLVNALLSKIKDFKPIMGELRPGIVHRLDKDTSGVIIVAKDEKALSNLSLQFKNRKVQKSYRALAIGAFEKEEFMSEQLIARSRSDGKKMAVRSDRGRVALTHFKVLQKFDGVALLEARPKTGRTHQIRVHLSNLGHPIVGDPLYLKKKMIASIKRKEVREKVEGFKRQALHAYSIEFDHPKSSKRVKFEAPIAKDILELINFFDGFKK